MIQFGILLLIGCMVNASKWLINMEIDSGRFFSRRAHDVLYQSIAALRSRKEHDEFDVTACVYSTRGMVNNPHILQFIQYYNMSLYFTNVTSLCILHHPQLDRYDHALQLNANADIALLDTNIFLESDYIHDNLDVIHLLQPACIGHAAAESTCNDNDLNSTCAWDRQGAYEWLQRAAQSCHGNSSPITSLPSSFSFTRAATAAYHTSGACQLWWPLQHSEVFVFRDSVRQVEPVILNCFLNSRPPFEPLIALIEQFNLSQPILSAVSLKFVNFDETLQLMIALTTPALVDNILLQVSICKESVWRRGAPVPYDDCIASFPLTLMIVRSDTIPAAKVPQMHPMAATLSSRDTFGYALNMMNISSGTFVEVGVHRGHFAALMLSQWNGRYILVDPWIVQSREEYVDMLNTQSIEQLESIYSEAMRSIEPYKHRVAVIKDTSVNAASMLVDNSVSVVYIDGLHHYEGVLDDIEAWWPKLRSGGIMAGHDYMLVAEAQTIFTVKPAVDEFARKMKLVVFQTHDPYPTWFMFKSD